MEGGRVRDTDFDEERKFYTEPSRELFDQVIGLFNNVASFNSLFLVACTIWPYILLIHSFNIQRDIVHRKSY